MDTNDNQRQLALDLLLGDVVKKAKDTANDEVTKLRNDLIDEIGRIRTNLEKIKSEVSDVLADTGTVVNLGTVEEPKKEKAHKVFITIAKALSAAKRKEKNIMLVGGAGGGKTHLVKQLAEAMKLPFYPMSVGMQTTKSDLLGFINAHGQYMPSIVRQAYENGGVLLLDEFDASHAGVVTILNSLLANGHASFPDKVIQKHKDFVCLVACNTFGNGASFEYVGRNRLDGATLDRFIVIEVDYDKKLEKHLTNNDFWYGIIQKVRKNAERCGIKIIVSPRASMDGADLLDAGFTVKDVLKMTVFKGCNEEIVKKLSNGIEFEQPKDERQEDPNPYSNVIEEHDDVFLIKDNSVEVLKHKENNGIVLKTLVVSKTIDIAGLRCVDTDYEDFALKPETYHGNLRNCNYTGDGCIFGSDYDRICKNIEKGCKDSCVYSVNFAFILDFKGRGVKIYSTKTGGEYNG